MIADIKKVGAGFIAVADNGNSYILRINDFYPVLLDGMKVGGFIENYIPDNTNHPNCDVELLPIPLFVVNHILIDSQ